jgi:sugar O-acyltransferase (sialic acid O-acetyltransferase NeuD family)
METVILGAGDFGKQLLKHYLEQSINNKIIGWFDDSFSQGDLIENFPCLGGIKNTQTFNNKYKYIIALGYKSLSFKERTLNLLITSNCEIINFVHHSVVISKSAKIGQGVNIYAGSIVDLNVTLSDGVVLNNNVIISHDSSVGCSSFVGPGVIVCGNVNIGKRCFIGAGSVIKDGVEICDDVIIGSGTNIYKNITKPGVYTNNKTK